MNACTLSFTSCFFDDYHRNKAVIHSSMKSHETAANIPRVGIGTFQLKSESMVHEVLAAALSHGIRLIDTAQCYKNEELISKSLSDLLHKLSLSRSDITVVSKLDPKNQGTDKAREAVEKTLKCFGGYVDVMLIHWPGVSKMKSDDPQVKQLRKESWKVLEEYQIKGTIRCIGVSNYNLYHLEDLMSYCSIKPSVLQNEFHPRYQETGVLQFCQEHDIRFMGYSPFGQGDLLSDKTVIAVAEKYNVFPSNVLVQWSIQKGVICIPRTSKPERVRENLNYSSFKLDNDDMEQLALLNDGHKFCWDPNRVV